MKNPIKILFSIITILSLGLMGCANNKIIQENELPEKIKIYLDTHFEDKSVVQVMMDNELFSKSYNVTLSDNTYIEFKSDHIPTEIKSVSKLPDSVIPNQIIQYVQANFPHNVILKYELDDREQQIELDNGLELEFDRAGNFIKVDQ